MENRDYTLEQLSKETGLKARTIRHYIQQELLLGPETRGRGATYTDYHRKRLLTIKELRSARLSIEQIREYFQMAAPDEDIKIVTMAVPTTADESPDSSSPLDFVRSRQELRSMDLKESPPGSEPLFAALPADSAPDYSPGSSSTSPIDQLLYQLQALAANKQVSRHARGEKWFRLAVTPDLELHIRGELSRQQVGLFEEIADHFRHILLGGKHE